jgi:hypothetical protein
MATTQLMCGQCGAAFREIDLDDRRRIATCPFCGALTTLPAESTAEPSSAPQATGTATPPRDSVRTKVPRPDTITCSETADGITLTYRWFVRRRVKTRHVEAHQNQQ